MRLIVSALISLVSCTSDVFTDLVFVAYGFALCFGLVCFRIVYLECVLVVIRFGGLFVVRLPLLSWLFLLVV